MFYWWHFEIIVYVKRNPKFDCTFQFFVSLFQGSTAYILLHFTSLFLFVDPLSGLYKIVLCYRFLFIYSVSTSRFEGMEIERGRLWRPRYILQQRKSGLGFILHLSLSCSGESMSKRALCRENCHLRSYLEIFSSLFFLRNLHTS